MKHEVVVVTVSVIVILCCSLEFIIGNSITLCVFGIRFTTAGVFDGGSSDDCSFQPTVVPHWV